MEEEESEDYGPIENGRIAVEEKRRIIDHQVETNERYEEQALGLLKISLTGLYLLITSVSVLYSTGYASRVNLPPLGDSVQQLIERLVAEFSLPPVQAELIVSSALGLAIALTAGSLFILVGEVPVRAYRVLAPSELSAGVSSREEYSDFENLLDAYEKVILENKDALHKIESNWKECYNSLRHGIILFGISIAVWVSIIYLKSAWFTTGILSVILIVIAYKNREVFYYSNIREYFVLDYWIDGSMFAVWLCLSVIAPLQSPDPTDILPSFAAAVVIFILIASLISSPVVALIRGIQLPTGRLQSMIDRNARMFIIFYLFFLTVSSATTHEMREGYELYWQSFGILVGILLVFSIIVFTSLLIQKGIQRVSNCIGRRFSWSWFYKQISQ